MENNLTFRPVTDEVANAEGSFLKNVRRIGVAASIDSPVYHQVAPFSQSLTIAGWQREQPLHSMT
jgi:hypothetical protein